MKKLWESILGGAVCAVFVGGAYCIAHYAIGLDDHAVMMFLLIFVWNDMTTYVNRSDKPSDTPAKS